jgi:hypothetical protein
MKDSLEEAKEDFFASMEKQGISEDEMAEEFYDDLVEIRDHYPRYYFSSFVLVWHTFIEREFLNICYAHNRNLRDDRSKYRDSSVDTSKEYLKEELKYPIDNSQWRELKFIQAIRNHIAHGSAGFRYLYEKPTDVPSVPAKIDGIDEEMFILIERNLYRYLMGHKIIVFGGPFYEIVPSYDFCKALIKFGSDVLSKIYTDLKMK